VVVSKILNKYEMLSDGNQEQIYTHLNDKPVQARSQHGLYHSDNLSTSLCGYAEMICVYGRELDDALSHHGVSYLHEAGDVGALHVVDVAVSLLAIFHAVLVDIVHDGVQTVVNFLG